MAEIAIAEKAVPEAGKILPKVKQVIPDIDTSQVEKVAYTGAIATAVFNAALPLNLFIIPFQIGLFVVLLIVLITIFKVTWWKAIIISYIGMVMLLSIPLSFIGIHIGGFALKLLPYAL